MSGNANRSLLREARHILHNEGISNHNAVLESAIRLVARKRPSMSQEGQWVYVCDMVETAYLLSLRIGGLHPEGDDR